MKKHKYIKPEVEIVMLNTESLLNTLSVPVGEGAGPGGGGQAKGGTFYEDEAEGADTNFWDD